MSSGRPRQVNFGSAETKMIEISSETEILPIRTYHRTYNLYFLHTTLTPYNLLVKTFSTIFTIWNNFDFVLYDLRFLLKKSFSILIFDLKLDRDFVHLGRDRRFKEGLSEQRFRSRIVWELYDHLVTSGRANRPS